MIITGQTIIANIFFDKYNEVKTQIEDQIKKEKYVVEDGEKYELFLYHGTPLSNHPKITQSHFLMHGDEDYEPIDIGLFGRGIYATENIFYASMYGNRFRRMNIKDKSSIFFCRSIFNPKYVIDIKEEDGDRFRGQILNEDIKAKYGIHRILVGDSKKYDAINEKDYNDSKLVATEFVFPNKFQIIPLCSFNVMRTEFYVLWADENEKYKEYSNRLKERTIYNIYYSGNIDELRDIIQTKCLNNIKLIVSSDDNEWVKNIINEVRLVYNSDVVCLIFSEIESQIELTKKIKNANFANTFDVLLNFINESPIPGFNDLRFQL